ncbi:MAG: hypothetical protein ACYC0Q_02730 [Eubacteriales bacterium]
MGVLTGKIPGRLEGSFIEKVLKETERFYEKLVESGEKYGVAIAEREVEARLENKR